MTIQFYSTRGKHGCFSNFSRHQVRMTLEGWKLQAPTSEHIFQAAKFFPTDKTWAQAIIKADRPNSAANMGRSRQHPLRPDWEEKKDDIMRLILIHKFRQHKSIQNILLDTLDEELVEHTVKDKYWADGGDGSGKNMLGKILMELRGVMWFNPEAVKVYERKIRKRSKL